ncbi:MAG: class I SAM-dependent methyltransferase [Patescibacteria group bacterium]|nr:class I SAM-dependent methyltransferase [Patescibacteria group bacterium]
MKLSERGGCPVCGFGSHGVGTVKVLCRPPGTEHDLCCCPGCGLVFSDTPLPQSQYNKMYAGRLSYAEPTPEWDVGRLTGVAATVAPHAGDGRVLDVGCGSGGLEAVLRKAGVKALGMDTRECALATLAHDPAVVGSLFDVRNVPGRFEVVVLSHVLEHVRDLRKGLLAAKDLLTPDGVVYVEVPDVMRYAECFDGPYQQCNEEHIQHFSKTTLAALMAMCDLEMVESGQREYMSPPPFKAASTWIVARPCQPRFGIMRCRDSQAGMLAYLERSVMEWERVKAKVAAVKGPAIVWGRGQLFRKLYPLIKDKVSFVVDAKSQECDGPSAIGNSDLPIIVASILHEREIVADIKRLGLPNEVVTLS